ncbi:MAG TPA: hypothetical protein VGG39_03520 [Polyangiaceae bacterium]
MSLVVAAALAATSVAFPAFAQQPPPLPPPPPPAPAAPTAAVVQATPPQPAPPPSPVPAPTPAQIEERRVHVDVESTHDEAVLERRVSLEEGNGQYVFLPYHTTVATWEQVCVTPCRVDLDRYSSYRVAGMNHVAGSHTFTLPHSGDQLSLQVQAGDSMWHRAGGVLTGAGVAAVIVGVALVAGAHVTNDETTVRNAGFVTGGAGIVVAVVGIPLMILNQTHVLALGKRIAVTPRGVTF